MASNSWPGVTIKSVTKKSVTIKSVTRKVSPGKVYDQNLVQLCGAIDASSEQSSCSDEHQHLARCGEDDTGQVGEGSLAERHLSRRLLLVLLLLLLSVDKEGAESVPASGDAATVKSKERRKKGGLGGAMGRVSSEKIKVQLFSNLR